MKHPHEAPAHHAQLQRNTPTADETCKASKQHTAVHEKTLPSIRKAFQGVSVVQ